jgi:hypothetical protein
MDKTHASDVATQMKTVLRMISNPEVRSARMNIGGKKQGNRTEHSSQKHK